MSDAHPQAGPRGGNWVQRDDGSVWWWNNCAVTDCPNKVCTWQSDRFCFPHSGNGLSVQDLIDEANERPAKVSA